MLNNYQLISFNLYHFYINYINYTTIIENNYLKCYTNYYVTIINYDWGGMICDNR